MCGPIKEKFHCEDKDKYMHGIGHQKTKTSTCATKNIVGKPYLKDKLQASSKPDVKTQAENPQIPLH